MLEVVLHHHHHHPLQTPWRAPVGDLWCSLVDVRPGLTCGHLRSVRVGGWRSRKARQCFSSSSVACEENHSLKGKKNFFAHSHASRVATLVHYLSLFLPSPEERLELHWAGDLFPFLLTLSTFRVILCMRRCVASPKPPLISLVTAW